MPAKNTLIMYCSTSSIVVLSFSEMLQLEQEKEYDFLNRRIIETFMEMSLLWLEPKWKKKILFSLKKPSPST